ncbi:MAG: adenine deaminase [Thermodesulfobacteriota bacterium]
MARGLEPADLLIKNARIVDVYNAAVVEGSVALAGEHIAALGDRPALSVLDLGGRYLTPGLADGHIHIESTMGTPASFSRAAVARGTTFVAADPHEIANVLGAAGIRYMLDQTQLSAMHIFYMAPSCVPASDLETAAARLAAAELAPFLDHDRVLGLAEMMNFPGVLACDRDVLEKIAAARRRRKRVDGHAPLLTGPGLSAYVAAGITSDHECSHPDEAREKLSSGMHIMIRQGTAAKNLPDLVPIVTPANLHRIMFCSDDRHPYDLCSEGHMDAIVRLAVEHGMDPVMAVIAATHNPARYFGLHDRGSVAPGRRADLVVASDLKRFTAEMVFFGGRLAAQNGTPVEEEKHSRGQNAPTAIRVDPAALSFLIPAAGESAHVIQVIPGQVLTGRATARIPIKNGLAQADPASDIAKLAVVESHLMTGNVGRGFVTGLGLARGAIASSVAHDAHNIIVAGANDDDMRAAVLAICEMGGGMAAALDGNILETLALPVAGLMSEAPMQEIAQSLTRLIQAARDLGVTAPDPFMTLSFLALSVIPHLKLTDRGLVDVDSFSIVPLFV